MLVPSSVEDGAPYESLHVIPRAYPEGIAGVSFCDGNVLVIGSKDHQVSIMNKHSTFVRVCMSYVLCVAVGNLSGSLHTCIPINNKLNVLST